MSNSVGGAKQNPPTPKNEEVFQGEDSVLEDARNFKVFIERLKKRLKEKVSPQVSRLQSKLSTSQKAGLVAKIDLRDFFKILIKTLLILVLTLTLFYIGFTLFKSLLDNSKENGATVPTALTPFPSYEPFKESYYATDSGVLRIEEDINILGREMSTTVLRETNLDPPSLDFNVSF